MVHRYVWLVVVTSSARVVGTAGGSSAAVPSRQEALPWQRCRTPVKRAACCCCCAVYWSLSSTLRQSALFVSLLGALVRALCWHGAMCLAEPLLTGGRVLRA
jgi:hypothetical protein